MQGFFDILITEILYVNRSSVEDFVVSVDNELVVYALCSVIIIICQAWWNITW